MIDDLLVRGTFVLQRTEDGYLISDLDLAVLLLACFDEFSCIGAIKNPNNPNQILFKITSTDLEKLDKVINSIVSVSSKIKELSADDQRRIQFANKLNMVRNNLKILIDKVKSK